MTTVTTVLYVQACAFGREWRKAPFVRKGRLALTQKWEFVGVGGWGFVYYYRWSGRTYLVVRESIVSLCSRRALRLSSM